ncbi:cytochrome P450 [Kribbella sp. NPDC050820]|uniref:cytochrome P450 n=1 Tax=Kribbella sp. NPDC050820 TaxID=3155408 RepID=UPI0033C468FC
MRGDRRTPLRLGIDFVEDPHPVLHRLRADDPLAWIQIPYGARGVLITRYDDARQVLTSGDVIKNIRPALGLAAGGTVRPTVSAHLLNSDGADHRRLRRCSADALRITAVEHWRGIIEETVAEQTERFLCGRTTGDLRVWADRIPEAVIGKVMGLTDQEASELADLSRPLVDQWHRGEVEEATRKVAARIDQVLGAERGPSGVRTLLAAHEARILDRRELVSSLFLTLFAGLETAAAFLGAAAFRLLAEYGSLLAMSDDSGDVLKELLRLEPPLAMATVRAARNELLLPSGPVPGGALIFVSLAAANRDPARFERPDELRPGRGGPVSLTFGAGDHFCLGHAPAQLEVATALAELARRAPRLRLQPESAVGFRPSVFIRTPDCLVVRWD